MSLLQLRFDTSKLQAFSNRIAAMATRARNLEPFMDDTAAYMANVMRNRILRTKKGPDGVAWQELSGLTEEIKGHGKILFHTGALARSIEVQEVNRDGFTIAATAPYAPFMQYGVQRTKGWVKKPNGRYAKPGPIPARPFMGFSDENARIIAKKLRAHIAGEEANALFMGDFQ